jgi:hypothetical protein
VSSLKKQAEVFNELTCNMGKLGEICNLCNRFLTSRAGCIKTTFAEDAAQCEKE